MTWAVTFTLILVTKEKGTKFTVNITPDRTILIQSILEDLIYSVIYLHRQITALNTIKIGKFLALDGESAKNRLDIGCSINMT